MSQTQQLEIRHVITDTRGIRLSSTNSGRSEEVHVITPATSRLVAPGDWCLAEFSREAKKCKVYRCVPLPGRHLVFVNAKRRGCTTRIGSLIGVGDLTEEIEPYLELTTDYQWSNLVRVHLVYEGAEHFVRDLIAAHPLPQK